VRQETILNYKNFLWLWIHLGALIVVLIIYALHDPIGAPNGGTWLGYSYGIIAALGMCVLMWFGIRKRSFFSSKTTLKGALAVHVWLGIFLLFLVPLHSGFSFGANVHTLAYILMVLAIFTGIWGAINYFSLAPEVGSHRGKGNLKELLQQLDIISSSIDALTIQKSKKFIDLTRMFDFTFQPTLKRALCQSMMSAPVPRDVAAFVSDLNPSEKDEGVNLIGLINRKYELANLIIEETRVHFWLKLWLYLHVPIAVAAFAVMVIHIISIFYYR